MRLLGLSFPLLSCELNYLRLIASEGKNSLALRRSSITEGKCVDDSGN